MKYPGSHSANASSTLHTSAAAQTVSRDCQVVSAENPDREENQTPIERVTCKHPQ